MGTFWDNHLLHKTHKVYEEVADENGESKIEFLKDKKGKQVLFRTINEESPLLHFTAHSCATAMGIAGTMAAGHLIEHNLINKEDRVNAYYDEMITAKSAEYQKSIDKINDFICPETLESIKASYEMNKEHIEKGLRIEAENKADQSKEGMTTGLCVGLIGFLSLLGAAAMKEERPIGCKTVDKMARKLNTLNRQRLAKKYPNAKVYLEEWSKNFE